MMMAQPEKEHAWLQKLVGAWTYEFEAAMKPGDPPAKFTGTESVRPIGGLWILAEGCGSMPDGTPSTAVLTLGYDPHRKKFVGTWVGSMMTHLWVYEGTLDADDRILTLETEGPNFAVEGKSAKYREVIEIRSGDHRLFSSSMLEDDGQWKEMMKMEYRRAK